jgi:ATP/maltotriose-dependent transcriptional regulator MalT
MLARLDEADRVTRSALDLRPSLGKLGQCAARARVEIQRGHVAEAQELLDAAADATAHAPGPTWIEPHASARIELELLRDRPEKALDEAIRVLVQGGDHEYVAFTARVHALGARAAAQVAERTRASGDDDAAAESAQRAQRLLDRIEDLVAPAAHPRGSAPPPSLAYRDVCAGEAARAAGTATAAQWSAIAQRLGEGCMRLDEAYARLREAECHLLDDERELAGEALAAGLEITRPCGAAWLQDQLDALARRGRILLPSSAPSAEPAAEGRQLGLTERELAVLELVAAGMTNREIGEQLFMATKTASVHVSRILAKLGVSSRVEAATAAQRLGLVA